MNVLSLFDGMSCGQIALERAGIKVDKYFASEINKYAIQVTQANYPNTIQLGDVTKIDVSTLPQIDLLIGGSPCQGFSFAGKQLNFNDTRSKLFFVYVEILNHVNPKYFMLENVKMKKEYQDIISTCLRVEPIEINSALVSAQNRKRLYWTNIPDVSQPNDKKIIGLHYGGNIVDTTKKLKHVIIKSIGTGKIDRRGYYGKNSNSQRVYGLRKKLPTLLTNNTGGNNPMWITLDDDIAHCASIEFCSFLQTIPIGYIHTIPNDQARKLIGNGWTVDVVAHIMKGLLNTGNHAQPPHAINGCVG